jgi:hypothetical protein
MVWGCSVYDSSLLGGQTGSSSQAGSSSGGTTAGPGQSGTGGRKDDTGGSTGTGQGGGTSAETGNGGAGAAGAADGGDAGVSSTAGADTAGAAGEVTCVPETPADYCGRVGKDCGSVDGTDNCGNAVVDADCGSCSGLKTCGGADQDSVCGALTDPALGGTASASSVFVAAEDASKAFDLVLDTKWYAGDSNATGWLAYQFPGTDSHAVRSYSVTSANDVPERDPATWDLQGSNDGVSWVTVDQRSAQVFASRRQTISYTCSNTTPYRRYRLLITANGGAPGLQLAELVLYAN